MWYKKLKHATLEKYQNRNNEIAPLPTSPASKPEPTQHPLSEKKTTVPQLWKFVQSQERKIGLNVPQKSMTFLQASLFCRTVSGHVGLVKWAMWVHREPILHGGLKDQKSTSLNKREKQKKKEQIEAQQSTKTQRM